MNTASKQRSSAEHRALVYRLTTKLNRSHSVIALVPVYARHGPHCRDDTAQVALAASVPPRWYTEHCCGVRWLRPMLRPRAKIATSDDESTIRDARSREYRTIPTTLSVVQTRYFGHPL